MHVTYRRGLTTDIQSVAMAHLPVQRDTWRGLVEDGDLPVFPEETLLAIWTARLCDPAVEVFVAEVDGQIIGAGTAAIHTPGGAEAEILEIFVARAMQCRGVGSRLMGALAGAVARRGCSSVIAWAPERNLTAIVFLRAIGGDIVDATPGAGRYTLPALQLRFSDLAELAFWDGGVSQPHRARRRPAHGGRSPWVGERTDVPGVVPPASGALPRD